MSLFCLIVLFLFLKFMMKTFENKISKIKLLKGIFASMTMYQQKQQKLLQTSTNKIKTVDQQAQAKKKKHL